MWKFSRWMSWNASRWRLGGKPSSGPAMSKPDDALVAEADRQLGDLHRARELAHGRDDGADDDGVARSLGLAHTALEAGQPGLHDLVERQPALGRELGRIADLGVDDAVGREVLRALRGHAGDGVGRLHHADGVGEALEVQLQRASVGAGPEPPAELLGILGGQAAVAGLAGQLDDGGRPQPAVEMIVQQHLGGAADRLLGDHAAMVPPIASPPFGDTCMVSTHSNARVTFLGHATILIEIDGVRVLTDPILRERVGPLTRTSGPPAPEYWSDIDVVLISHSHWDHLDYGSLKMMGFDVRSSPVPAWPASFSRAASAMSPRSSPATRRASATCASRPSMPSTRASARRSVAPNSASASSCTARSPSTSPATPPSSRAWPTSTSASTWPCCRSGAGGRRPSPTSTSTPWVRLERPRSSSRASPCPSTGARCTRSASAGCDRRRASTRLTSSPS